MRAASEKEEEGTGSLAARRPRVLLGLPFYGFVFVAPLLSSKEAFLPAPSVASPFPSPPSPRPPFDTVFVPGRVEGFDPALSGTAFFGSE